MLAEMSGEGFCELRDLRRQASFVQARLVACSSSRQF
jgi:hypothetical protein